VFQKYVDVAKSVELFLTVLVKRGAQSILGVLMVLVRLSWWQCWMQLPQGYGAGDQEILDGWRRSLEFGFPFNSHSSLGKRVVQV